MELTQLKYFKKVAQHQSVSMASDELHISQSALSRSIAKLEEELGVRLFDRNGKRIALNKDGESFLVDVNRILDDIDDSVRSLGSQNGGTSSEKG